MSNNEVEGAMPPGTMWLTDLTTKAIVLQPTPSNDPGDPLNWSKIRKAINFSLALIYVMITFVLLDIFGISYSDYVDEFGMTFNDYNTISALNYAGLAVGCVLLIPLVYKFGRRPLYLISLVIQFATAIWAAKANSVVEMMPLFFIQGFGGAISETIVQITIADLFFVHQYATMNGLFFFSQCIGAYIGPVIAGYIVVDQGWRWQWWWCAIFLGINLVMVFLFFEETSWVPVLDGSTINSDTNNSQGLCGKKNGPEENAKIVKVMSVTPGGLKASKPWSERLRLYTKTQDSIRHHFWQPFLFLMRIPAVIYAALTYGILLANVATIASVGSGWLFYPPYNFDAAAVGLFNLAPFIGALLASFIVAPLSDRLIVRLARKNGGVYEAEMRLWPTIPCSMISVGGFLMFGIGIAQEQPWTVLAVGAAIFGFGFVSCADIALSYLSDTYQNLIGDAIVGVIFVRNAISVIILFVLTPWIEAVSLQYMFVSLGLITLVILLGFPLVFLFYGKKFRLSTWPYFEKYSRQENVSGRV